MTAPAVSVVIPMRDEASTVGAQLDALAGQDLALAWELVVVDNGSTDGSAAVVEGWRGRLPELRLVDVPGATNQAQARNAGAAVARGSLLVHADADDVVAPGWLQALVAALDDHDLVSGPIEVTQLNPADSFGWRAAEHDPLPLAHGFLPYASSSNLGIRRSVFDALGGFDGTLRRSADVDLSWRAQLAGHQIGAAPEALVHRRLRTDARGLFRQHRGYGESTAVLYRRYRDRGMPPSPPREAAREWGHLVARAYRLGDPSARRSMAVVAGRRTGRLVGSIRHRVLYL